MAITPLGNGADESDLDRFSSTPSGGLEKLIPLGIILPIGILWYSIHAWTSEKALWLFTEERLTIHGAGARAAAVTYFFTAMFAHMRWFWGIVPNLTAFIWGTKLSLIGMIGGIGATLYFVFRYGS